MNGLINSDNQVCILNSFKNEDGFSSHVYALVLLLCVTLVFSLATSQWVMQKTSTVQTVADTAALSASNTVGSYRQVAQLTDAVIFTVGFTGVLCVAVGFVVSCIPVISSFGVGLTEFGVKTIQARNRAVEQVYRTLEGIEDALPFIIGYSAVRTVRAQSSNELKYHGIALPFPMQSESDFPDKNDISVPNDTVAKAREMADKTEKAERYRKQQDEALQEGWYADCGNPTHSLRERAEHLAGLNTTENPDYPTPDDWTFAAPILRSRNYYAKRIDTEAPESSEIEDIRASACRKNFYTYAYNELLGAYVRDNDTTYESFMPKLPATLDDYRNSSLYTDANWLSDGTHLHAYANCPEVRGVLHPDYLKSIDDGSLTTCPHCQLSISDQALVTRLTSINETGYEYWYKKVAEASDKYEDATREIKKLEHERKEDEKNIAQRFKEITDQLSMKRVKFIPPGSRGCIALVYREDGAEIPSKLTGPFVEPQHLPSGYAIAGSALAPDKNSDENHMMRTFASSILPKNTVGGIAGVCLDVWGNLLIDYGKGLDSIDSGLDSASQNLGPTTGSSVQRFKSLLNDTLAQVGLEPVDLRTYKPTLVQAIKIIDAEYDVDSQRLYELFQSIPASEYEFLHYTLSDFGLEIEDGYIKICDIDIPFSPEPIRIRIPIGVLWPG